MLSYHLMDRLSLNVENIMLFIFKSFKLQKLYQVKRYIPDYLVYFLNFDYNLKNYSFYYKFS